MSIEVFVRGLSLDDDSNEFDPNHAYGYIRVDVRGKPAKINRFHVDPKNRNKGVGSQMYQEFEEWAKEHGATTIEIFISPDNDLDFYDTVAFFTGKGFGPKGDHERRFIKDLVA